MCHFGWITTKYKENRILVLFLEANTEKMTALMLKINVEMYYSHSQSFSLITFTHS